MHAYLLYECHARLGMTRWIFGEGQRVGTRGLPAYIQCPHSNCIFKFYVFSLSNCKFSLCLFYAICDYYKHKLTWQMYPAYEKNW